MSKLDELKEKTERADLPLKDGHNIVFGKGNPSARIFFIGEAPGEKEDAAGVPFVGSAGKQLDKLLGSIGLSIEDVYITNILKYRPPDNRNPNEEEIRAHTPYLVEQIKIVQPKIIVTLGNFATRFVLAGFDADKMKPVEGITKLHGKVNQVKLGDKMLLVLPMYHPAAVLYNPKLRSDLEKDFVLLGKITNPSSSTI